MSASLTWLPGPAAALRKIVRYFLDITALVFTGPPPDTMNFPPSDSTVPWFQAGYPTLPRPRPAVLPWPRLEAGHARSHDEHLGRPDGARSRHEQGKIFPSAWRDDHAL